ncbi:LysR substrate-binding domain-containing protein [Burkholderia guangdongensis]|uniref:LysR substrate-binding domain-containing protein n=1 Tax=Burkholderia guangdongensis TaxID=1792500 RepID=UPI0015CC0E6E
MDLRQIEYFVALFEDGSVTRAAKRLNIVQSALSMQIGRLEKELGQSLFERGPHGMSPTAAGGRTYQLFVPILRDIADAREQLLHRESDVTGHVTLGVIASMAESVLASAMARFHERYPHVQVTISVGYSATLIDWVSGGQLDAAIINSPRSKLRLSTEPLLDEEMVLVTGQRQNSPLPASVDLSRLQDYELVLPTRRHGLRNMLDDAARQAGVVLTPKFEIDALNAIVELVTTTRFAAVLPSVVVQRAVRSGALNMCSIGSPPITRRVVRICRAEQPLGAAVQALIDTIVSEIRGGSGIPGGSLAREPEASNPGD